MLLDEHDRDGEMFRLRGDALDCRLDRRVVPLTTRAVVHAVIRMQKESDYWIGFRKGCQSPLYIGARRSRAVTASRGDPDDRIDFVPGYSALRELMQKLELALVSFR